MLSLNLLSIPKPVVYIMINCEMDGPNPSRNNMLELAAVAFHVPSSQISVAHVEKTFSVKLKPVPERKQDEVTMSEFWARNTEAWSWVTSEQKDVEDALRDFILFLSDLEAHYLLKFVASPASKDFVWLQAYFNQFLEASVSNEFQSRYGYCECLQTMRTHNQRLYALTDSEAWELRHEMQGGIKITHRGLDSATAQANEFCALIHSVHRRTHEHSHSVQGELVGLVRQMSQSIAKIASNKRPISQPENATYLSTFSEAVSGLLGSFWFSLFMYNYLKNK